jgi:hypothetical protein
MEEALHLFLVDVSHLLGRDCDNVAILVTALLGKGVDIILVCDAVIEDAELG